MYKIPKEYEDLRRHILKTDIRRLVLFALWMALFLAGALYYNDSNKTSLTSPQITGWRLAIYLFCVGVLGFFLFRVWKFFTDRTYVGTIQKSGLSHTYSASEDPYAFKPLTYDYRTNTALEIIPEGKKKAHRLRFEQKIGSYWYYDEGQTVIRFHGCPYPLNVDPTAPHGYICVACGRMHKTYQDECDACFLSLIDPARLKDGEA